MFIAFTILPLISEAQAQQNIFGNILATMAQQQALQQNAARWSKIPQQERNCIDQELRKDGFTLSQLINKGITPESPNLSVTRMNCRNQTQPAKQDNIIGNANGDEFFPDGKYLPREADCRKLLNDKNAEFDSMLTIKGNEITGYEMGCTIKSKEKNGASYRVEADCGGEGETWNVKTDFKTDGKKYNFGQLSNNRNYLLCVRTPTEAATPVTTSATNTPANTISQPSPSNKTIALGSHCGSTASITQLNGADTTNAFLQAAMTRDQAIESCTCDAPSPEAALKGKKLEACIQAESKNIYIAKADCGQGLVTDTTNRVRQFTGKVKDDSFELLEQGTGQAVETISATGYYVTMSQFSQLCPKRACVKIPASDGLDGCRP